MAAFRIAAQMIAHQAVEAVEVFPHVCRASRNIYPRCRSKPEHRLRPVQYGQQALQRFRIESTTHFDPAPASQLNKQNTVAPGIVAAIPRRGGNHFDGNKSSSSQLPSTMHALTIFIKRLYRQASLMAKSSPQQSTRFKLRNQGLNLGQTTSPVLHSHFAHSYSAPLNEEREQGGLLGRIRMLTPVFHPNFGDVSVCTGDFWAASEGLDDLMIRIGRMIAYQEYNTKSPLNGLASKWAAQNVQLLPIDPRGIAPPSRDLAEAQMLSAEHAPDAN